jgi:hypothetical protein
MINYPPLAGEANPKKEMIKWGWTELSKNKKVQECDAIEA